MTTITKENLESKYKEVSTEYVDINNRLNVALMDNTVSEDQMIDLKKQASAAKTRMQGLKFQIDQMTDESENQAQNVSQKTLQEAEAAAKIKDEKQVKAFKNMLISQNIQDAIEGGIGLSEGQVLIPEQILTPEQDTNQFPHLKDLIRTITVSSTTGKLPIFAVSDQVMKEHKEFTPTDPSNAPVVKTINWDLVSYTAQYIYSQELIKDSAYDWESELQMVMSELEDNTDDNLIVDQLTKDIPANKSTDLIKDMKHILNKELLPNDSRNSTIIMSQTAYDDLDSLKDTLGRGLFESDLTSPSGSLFKGRNIVTVSDLLFPGAKDGDENIIIAPLQKAAINFKQGTITGQFQDTHDMWYKALGLWLRQNVVQARQDVIKIIGSVSNKSNSDTGATGNSGSGASGATGKGDK